MNRPACLALVAVLAAAAAPAAEPVTSGFHAAPPAAAPAPARARQATRAPVPAANFLVEWRVQPSDPQQENNAFITWRNRQTAT